MKYIAIKEAMDNQIKEHHLVLDRMNDENILKEGFASIMPLKKAKEIASSIVKTKLTHVKPLVESADKLDLPKSMIDNVFSTNEEVKTSLNECLFYIVSNPARYTASKETFVNTIKKYII